MKAVFTQKLANDIIFPNIAVFRKYRDGVHCGYEVFSDPGYVMYDTTAEDYEQPHPDSAPTPTTYYYPWLSCPVTYDFSSFTWVAVPRNIVPNDHVYDRV